MLSISSGYSLTCNWIAERKPARKDNSNFWRLIDDSVRGLREDGGVYVFTMEHVREILKRFGEGALVWEKEDYYYIIRRVKR